MRISPNIEEQTTPTTLNNCEVPIVLEYTYLGIQLNNQLDFKRIADYRIPKGNHLINTIWKTLVAAKVSVAYKMMLIKSVLIPMITYGIEIYGHKYSYLSEIKNIINRAIGKTLQWPNFCRTAVYEELNIPQIEEMGRYRQQKSVVDWCESEGPFSHIMMKEKITNRIKKKTWLTEATNYLKKNKIDYSSKKAIRQSVHELFANIDRFNTDSKIGTVRENIELNLVNR